MLRGEAEVAHEVVAEHRADADQQARPADHRPLHQRAQPHHRDGDRERVGGLAAQRQPALGDQEAQLARAWVSGWITSGTRRLTLAGSDSVSMFENW